MSPEKYKIFIIDYAYGFHAGTCDVDYVSRLRSQAALRALEKYPDAHIVLGAGMKKQTGDCGPLADIMERYFEEKGVTDGRILRNPKGHDTLSETEAAHAVIGNREDVKIVCTTSAFHAPRVWVVWVCRYSMTPEMYTSKLTRGMSAYMHEIVAFPRDVVRSLWHRLRR